MRWVAMLMCLVCATAQADDWSVKRHPFDPVVIRQYKTILARDPHDAGLQRLVALYKGYSTIAKLEAEYRAQLDTMPADWATLVVLARLPRGDRPASIALWNRALQANPKDARGWLALGEITIDGAAARAAFQRAVEHARSTRDKKVALNKLIGAARSANDATTVDGAYEALIALEPKNGQLWLDRGSAQLAANRAAVAIDSFAKAEALLATDPERRLVAMMNRGVALERLGRVDEAIAQWELTLDKAPRGSYLRREVVPRIVDAERKRERLPAAIALLQKRWPEPRRAYYEWDLFGDLHLENGDEEVALGAYRRAVAKAPTEVGTQRKLIKLLDKLRPAEALGQHEAAAKLAPGDANLQIELAKRYYEIHRDHAKAMATLDRLTKRLAKDVGVRIALAELYTQWDNRARALVEYEAIAELEPNEIDHAVVLGDAYWRAGYRPKAIEAWKRLAKIETAAAALRHGEILALHGVWEEAATAFTQAIALDARNADAWRGRARAHDELGRHSDAVADAKRAVALIGTANSDAGIRVRHQLVRALGRWHAMRSGGPLSTELARWRFAFERGDIAAGYLLVAHHDRIRSHQRHDTLVELYRRVPNDDALGIAVARSYSRREDWKRARMELEKIALRTPKRAGDIAHLIDQVETDRLRAIEDKFREEEGNSRKPPMKDIVGRKRRLGFRLGVGADVYGTSSALIGFGAYRMHRLRAGTAFATRIDWTRRDAEGDEVKAFAVAVGVSQRILDTRRFELAAAIGPRVELRYGSSAMQSSWGRGGLAGDLSLEVVPRALPVTVGMRFQQALTDRVRGSALVVELGFEVR